MSAQRKVSHGQAREEGRLSTLNEDGSRRKLFPTPAPGRFMTGRRIAAYVLLLIFTVVPYLKMNGKPMILLDLPARRFTIFGYTFLPTDTLLLMLLLVSIVIAIFLLTALYGRVWCGWACPQTVYLEFVFRPIERLIEGTPAQQRKRKAEGGANVRGVIKVAVFGVLSLFLAHTFLAYFVGVDALLLWVQRSPLEHPAAFLLMAGVSVAMFVDFGWFREQTCLVACPYGRLQSVLLDRQSLIVGYDERRGEPRGKRRKNADTSDLGDCIDCGACVRCCPTGIDIRDGLQMECIGCAQCIDACDVIMDRVEKPRGLIRYSTQDELDGKPRKLLRPRVIVYPALLIAVLSLFVMALRGRASSTFDVVVRRGIGAPFTRLPDGSISNQLRVRIVNRADTLQRYRLEVLGVDGRKMPQVKAIIPINPLPVPPGETGVSALFVTAPRSLFKSGEPHIIVEVRVGKEPPQRVEYNLLGPTS